MKIGTSGFRYRVAYGCFKNAPAWAVQPARSFHLLMITPRAVWIDPYALEQRVLDLQDGDWPRRPMTAVDAFNRAKSEALRQLDQWIGNLRQITERAIASRQVARRDIGPLTTRASKLRAQQMIAAE